MAKETKFLALIAQEVLYVTVLLRVSIAIKRQHDHGNSYKGKYLLILMVGNMAEYNLDMVLEQEWRVLHPDRQAARRKSDTGPGISFCNPKPTLQ